MQRLNPDLFDIVVFGDNCILNEPIENWPVVECLIAFFSTKFPIEKAIEYVHLRKPYMINDLEMHGVLSNRRKVYETLESVGIEVPRHIFVERSSDKPDSNEIEEHDDYVIINGTRFNKPLVEKPFDAEDHNIYIYCKPEHSSLFLI